MDKKIKSGCNHGKEGGKVYRIQGKTELIAPKRLEKLDNSDASAKC